MPLDKEWSELTKEQQLAVRGEYSNLPEGSEPPFPIGGTRTIYKPIAQAYQRIPYNFGDGEIFMLAYIDSTGTPTKVEIYKTVDDKRFTSFAVSTIMGASFKPGLCEGIPCTMPYAISMQFRRE